MVSIDPALQEYMDHIVSNCTHVHALAETSGYGAKALARIKTDEHYAIVSTPFAKRVTSTGSGRGTVGTPLDEQCMRTYTIGLENIYIAAATKQGSVAVNAQTNINTVSPFEMK